MSRAERALTCSLHAHGSLSSTSAYMRGFQPSTGVPDGCWHPSACIQTSASGLLAYVTVKCARTDVDPDIQNVLDCSIIVYLRFTQ